MQEPLRMRPDAPRHDSHDTNEELLRAMTGRDAGAQLPMVARTRRAIRIADDNRREQGEQGRRHIGITLFAFAAIFLILAPAMWGSIDDIIGGEHFSDLPAQVTLLSTFLMLAVMGALAAVWRSRAAQDEFRQDR